MYNFLQADSVILTSLGDYRDGVFFSEEIEHFGRFEWMSVKYWVWVGTVALDTSTHQKQPQWKIKLLIQRSSEMTELDFPSHVWEKSQVRGKGETLWVTLAFTQSSPLHWASPPERRPA